MNPETHTIFASEIEEFSRFTTTLDEFNGQPIRYIDSAFWNKLSSEFRSEVIIKELTAREKQYTLINYRYTGYKYQYIYRINLEESTDIIIIKLTFVLHGQVVVDIFAENHETGKSFFREDLVPFLNSLLSEYTELPKDPAVVPVTFTYLDSTGDANISSREIICPSWEEIKANYPLLDKHVESLLSIKEPESLGKFIFWHGVPGSGKCMRRGTPILKFNGEVVPIETIKVGDLLMGPDSKPRKVLSTTKGYGKMYEVTPTKGDPYTVNDQHVLSLKNSGTEDIVNVPIEEYLQDIGTSRFRLKGWRTGVDWSKQEIPLPPYIFGLWLGDGNNNADIITTEDSEVVTELERFVTSIGLELSKHKTNSSATLCRIVSRPNHATNPVLDNLRSLNVIGNKHIPLKYCANDRHSRLELLAGLIDFNGNLSTGGYEITTEYPKLRDGILFVARSLGFAAYSNESEKYYQKGGGGIYHRIFISGDVSQIPVRIERKKAAPRKHLKDVLKTGISVDHADDAEYFGFELDGDSLYLLGDFTVTHNSYLIRSLMREWKKSVDFIYVIDPERFFNNGGYMKEILVSRIRGYPDEPEAVESFDVRIHPDNTPPLKLFIIEDGLNFLLRESRGHESGAMSRLLNLTDGILGQGLRLLFLVTSNEKEQDIDPAFLRAGRCLQRLKFSPFTADQARQWFKNANVEPTIPIKHDSLYTLSELYAEINKDTLPKQQVERMRIGINPST